MIKDCTPYGNTSREQKLRERKRKVKLKYCVFIVETKWRKVG